MDKYQLQPLSESCIAEIVQTVLHKLRTENSSFSTSLTDEWAVKYKITQSELEKMFNETFLLVAKS